MPSPLKKILFVRSPYIVTVDESPQTSSKIEIYIWKYGGSQPATPDYTLSKDAPSTTQTANYYNVSPYIYEAFNFSHPEIPNTPEDEDAENWRFVKIIRYSNNSLLEETLYVAVNGYTNFLDGVNKTTTIDDTFSQLVVPLINTDVPQIREYGTTYYFNLLWNDFNEKPIEVFYYNNTTNALLGSYLLTQGSGNTSNVKNYKVPISYSNTINQRCVVKNGEYNLVVIYSSSVEECKYEPMVCSFINKYGGWQFVTFFKANEQKVDVKSKEYKLLPENVDYNVYKGESQMFNFELTESVKVNTGWVEEYFSIVLKELMTSETILLENKPVKLKTTNSILKQTIKEKNINYEIDFEYTYNQINNVV